MFSRTRSFLPSRFFVLSPKLFPQLFTFSSKHSGGLYKVLDLPSDATNREIKDAFYKLSKFFHPDISKDSSTRAKFEEIKQAYEILGNPTMRQKYDRGLVSPAKGFVSDRATEADKVDLESVIDASEKSFATAYADRYNRQLTEAWLRNAKPEYLGTTAEIRSSDVKIVLSFLLFLVVLIDLNYLHYLYTEDPLEPMLPESPE